MEIYELTVFNLHFMYAQAYAYNSLNPLGNCLSVVLSNQDECMTIDLPI